MKLLLFSMLLCSLSMASSLAQQQPVPSPENAALSQEVLECMGAKIQLRVKISQLEAELTALKAKLSSPDDQKK